MSIADENTRELIANPFVVHGNRAHIRTSHCENNLKVGSQKSLVCSSKQKHLSEIFEEITSLADVIDRKDKRNILEELDLVFRLINAEKGDRKMQKQLTLELEELNNREPEIVSAIECLRQKAQCYPDPVNFMQLLQYLLYLFK